MVKSTLIRTDPAFKKLLCDTWMERNRNGLVKSMRSKEIGTSEVSRLLMRTENFSKALEEVKKKPKKEDLI